MLSRTGPRSTRRASAASRSSSRSARARSSRCAPLSPHLLDSPTDNDALDGGQGWDTGLLDMCPGEKRVLTIPVSRPRTSEVVALDGRGTDLRADAASSRIRRPRSRRCKRRHHRLLHHTHEFAHVTDSASHEQVIPGGATLRFDVSPDSLSATPLALSDRLAQRHDLRRFMACVCTRDSGRAARGREPPGRDRGLVRDGRQEGRALGGSRRAALDECMA